MVFVWCPPGWVAMGGSSAEVRAEIAHGFWLSQCPVTQEQWRRLMGSERGAFRSGAGGSEAAKVAAWDTSWFPAESVTWAEASAFCRRLTDCERKAGRLPIDWEYRLPREAQWEHACRAGSGSRVGSPAAYGFGDEESRLSEHAWHLGNSDGRTHQVGDRKPNRWGLRDMHGNVWEWCSDLYLSEPFRGQADDELRRSVRGGAFDSSPQECRAAHRSCRAPFDRGGDLGFRVAIVSLLTDWGGWAGKDDGPPKDED